jgi:DNA-binding transcriptional ArsR family regulator
MDDLDPLFRTLAGYFGVLGEPVRLKIMHALCLGEKTVGEVVQATGASQTNVSRHLGLMHRHHMLNRRKTGTQVFYSVADPSLVELCRELCGRFATTLAERTPPRRQMLRLLPTPKRRAAG